MRYFGHLAIIGVAAVLVISLVGNLAFAGPATTASSAAHHQYGKTPVCHATGSAKNPYVFLKVPLNSAHFGKHPDDLFGPAIDSKNDCPEGNGKKDEGKGKTEGKGKNNGKNEAERNDKGKSKGKDKNVGKGSDKGKDKGKNAGKGNSKGKGKGRAK